jgi:hypothetical protein
MIMIFELPLSYGGPTQVSQDHLSVDAELGSQVFSSLGFYDTIFPLHIILYVSNPTNVDFPGGGYLTGRITAPSGKWQNNLQFNLTAIPADHSYEIDYSFTAQESGVYILTIDPSITYSFGPAPNWAVSGGFLAFQVEPPSTLFLFLILVVLIFGFVATDLSLIAKFKGRKQSGIALSTTRRSVLQQALNLFEAGQKLDSYLLDPRDDVQFEAGVSWLLQILGFQAVRLNKGAQGEKLRVQEGQAQIRSADILLSDPTSQRFSVVTCTIGVPGADKRQRIRLTADEVSSRLGNCDSMIITSVDTGPTIANEARQEQILLVDKTKLEAVLELVKAKRFDRAKRYFTP